MKTRRSVRRLRLKTIKRSHNPEKKYDAVFLKPDGSTKTQSFGQKGYNDFIRYNSKYGRDIANDHKRRYLTRHRGMNEDWNDPTTAGALAKWILWNKPSFRESVADYKKRFNL